MVGDEECEKLGCAIWKRAVLLAWHLANAFNTTLHGVMSHSLRRIIYPGATIAGAEVDLTSKRVN